jgi:putative ABC transport system permease protein
LSGLYPAFFLASFSPIKVIKNSKTKSSQWQRKGLIVFQFSLSIFFIIATLVSFKQFNLIRRMNLGFDNKHSIYFFLKTTKSDYQTLREKLLKIPEVEMVGGKEYYSPTIMNMANVKLPGEETKNVKFSENFIDEDFFSLLKVKFADGHNFSKDIKSEWDNGVIINQKAKELIGEDPLGKALSIWGRQFKIIGVLDETHFRNVNESDQPEFYVYTYSPLYIFVRYSNNFSIPINHLTDQVRKTVKELYPEAPFDFKFLDATYARLYENDKRVKTIYAFVAVIAILISCIGLFGLSSFSTENRTKEIGIRKINGARISEILIMLNTDFIFLIIIAYIIVVPIAWYSMHKWLQSFTYKTDLNWSIFALAGLLALAIALITVSWQSWRAATRNPVDALRYE